VAPEVEHLLCEFEAEFKPQSHQKKPQKPKNQNYWRAWIPVLSERVSFFFS
jgi:hypothetical protein